MHRSQKVKILHKIDLGRSNSRKSSNSRKNAKNQSKTKAIYDSKPKERYHKLKPTPARSNSKTSSDLYTKMALLMNASFTNPSMKKRPLSPTPMYLAADIARFHKLSQQLKANKGNSSLGFVQSDKMFSNMSTQPVMIDKSKPGKMHNKPQF